MEVDETYLGNVEIPRRRVPMARLFKVSRYRHNRGRKGKAIGIGNKRAIVTLVERHGKVRSFHVPRADKKTVARIVADNIAHEAHLHTDESGLYKKMDEVFAGHETTNHSKKEYVRYENGVAIHSNSAEGYFSIFKRGMKGVYQHCSEKHLHRYLAEFDFRYNHREVLGCDDEARCIAAIRGAEGKRLTYPSS